MKARLLIPLILAPLGYVLIRAAVVDRVRRYETVDADTADLPGARFYLRGRRLHLTIDGQGPPLLMLHGFGSSGVTFGRLARVLGHHVTVIAPDLPGWGYSERSPEADHSHEANAALMLELLDRLGIGTAAVLGHGSGATIAVRMAQAAPERIAALILSGRRGRDPRLPAWLGPLLTVIVPVLVESRWGQRWLIRSTMRHGSRPDDDEIAAHLNEARVFGHSATLLAMLTRTRHAPTPDIRGLHVPTLVVTGNGHFTDEAQLEPATATILAFLREAGLARAAHPEDNAHVNHKPTGAIGL